MMQENNPFAENLPSDLIDEEQPSGDEAEEIDADDDDDDSGDDSDDDDYDDSVYDGNGRRKRQADLSSHTEDGVPIYDRGYGIPTNRTEGLRIYQSLLNGGRTSAPKTTDANWEVVRFLSTGCGSGHFFSPLNVETPSQRSQSQRWSLLCNVTGRNLLPTLNMWAPRSGWKSELA